MTEGDSAGEGQTGSVNELTEPDKGAGTGTAARESGAVEAAMNAGCTCKDPAWRRVKAVKKERS